MNICIFIQHRLWADEQKMPPHRQCLNVGGNFQLPLSKLLDYLSLTCFMHLTYSNKFYFKLKILTLIFFLASKITGHSQVQYLAEYINVDGKKMAYKSYGLKTRKTNEPVLVFESGIGGGKEN